MRARGPDACDVIALRRLRYAQDEAPRARRIPHGKLSRAGARNARRRARSYDQRGRDDLAHQAAAFSSTCCRARQNRQIFPRARSGATSRGSIFPAASGCLTPATASWRRRPKTICDMGLPVRPAATPQRLLVIYCQADCWMSWNAAKRALSYGYPNVAWYPDGTDGWERAGLAVSGFAAGAASGRGSTDAR